MEAREVIVFFTLSLIVCGTGTSECDSEPCRDLFTAKSCDKVKFCIAEDWSKLRPTGNRDNVCDTCLRMVKEARDTLQSNETREELLQVFEGSCRLLVLKPAVEVCDKIVDQFVPELVEILSSEMDPETVCSVAKLCNNDVFRTAQKESKECTSCEKLTESAAKEMENISLERFKNKILYLCRYAGTFSDACTHFGLEHSSSLYNYSKIILNKKPCEAISLCPSGVVGSQTKENGSMFENIEEKMCPLTMDVMTNIRKQLLRVKSAEEFEEKMMSACGRMGFSESACSKVSNPSLFEKLKSWDTLPLVLSQVTYCRAKSEDKDVPFWPLVPAHNGSFSSAEELDLVELLEKALMFFPVVVEEKTELRKEISYGDPIKNPMFFTPSLYVAQSGDCKTCVDVLEALSESAKTDKGNLEEIFNNVCSKSQDVEVCKRFITNFSPVLEKAFADNFVPNLMCEDLVPFCKVDRDESRTAAVTDENTCRFCLDTARVFKYCDSDSLSQVINERCNTLPENSRERCMSSLTPFLHVLKNYTEFEICNSLKYCSSSAGILPNISVAHAEAFEYCDTCLNTFHGLSELMNSSVSDVIIREIFDSLCNLLPHIEYKMCRKITDVIGIGELKKLIENIKPMKICTEIHLCDKKEELDLTTLPDLSSKITSTETNEKVPCKFCLMAVRTLLDQLQDDKTETSIRKALNNLCKYLPEETRDTCRNLIDEYTEDIIDMIIADFNPSEICTFLKICPARHLLGDTYEKDFPVFDIRTNEVRDENSWKLMFESISRKSSSVTVDKPMEKDLQRLHRIVKECALCEALVGVVSSHKKMLDKNYDFSANAQLICSIVPADEKKKCMSMIVSYGPSIVNLITDQKVDPNDVCVRVDLCDPKMQAKVNLPVSVPEEKFIPNNKNDCMLGPVFWCANAENAEKCGTFLHCQETVWKNWKNPPRKATRE